MGHLFAAALLCQETLDLPVTPKLCFAKRGTAKPALSIYVLLILQELLDPIKIALVRGAEPAQLVALASKN